MQSERDEIREDADYRNGKAPRSYYYSRTRPSAILRAVVSRALAEAAWRRQAAVNYCRAMS